MSDELLLLAVDPTDRHPFHPAVPNFPLVGDANEGSMPARHQAVRFLVDSRAGPARNQLDATFRSRSMVDAIDNAELADAETPQSGKFVLKSLAGVRIGADRSQEIERAQIVEECRLIDAWLVRVHLHEQVIGLA